MDDSGLKTLADKNSTSQITMSEYRQNNREEENVTRPCRNVVTLLCGFEGNTTNDKIINNVNGHNFTGILNLGPEHLP